MARQRKEPSAEALALLRANTNVTQVADELGVARATIRRWRAAYLKDATAGSKGRPKVVIPDEAIELLGMQPDYVLALQFNVSATTIRRSRTELGIQTSRKTLQGIPKKFRAQMGVVPDYAIATEHNVSVATIRKERRANGIAPRGRAATPLPEHVVARLGRQSDQSLAITHNLGVWVIRSTRVSLGIDAYQPKRTPGTTRTPMSVPSVRDAAPDMVG